MSKPEYYVQCKFINKHGAIRYTMGWIPEWAAVVDNKVQLLSLDGEFWMVTEVGKIRKSKEEVKEDERAFKDFQGSLKGGGIDQ